MWRNFFKRMKFSLRQLHIILSNASWPSFGADAAGSVRRKSFLLELWVEIFRESFFSKLLCNWIDKLQCYAALFFYCTLLKMLFFFLDGALTGIKVWGNNFPTSKTMSCLMFWGFCLDEVVSALCSLNKRKSIAIAIHLYLSKNFRSFHSFERKIYNWMIWLFETQSLSFNLVVKACQSNSSKKYLREYWNLTSPSVHA